MNLKERNIIFVMLLVLVFFGCDEERSPEQINEDLRDFLEGTSWISEAASFDESSGEQSTSYNKYIMSFNQSKLRVNDTLYFKRITSEDTIVFWYRYIAIINIDKYDFYQPNVGGDGCITGFDNPVNRGNLELNKNNIQWEYNESSEMDIEFIESIAKDHLGNLVVTDQAGDTLALEDCFNQKRKFVRVP